MQQQQTCNNKVKRLGHKKHTYLPVYLPTCIPTYSHTFRQTDRQNIHAFMRAGTRTMWRQSIVGLLFPGGQKIAEAYKFGIWEFMLERLPMPSLQIRLHSRRAPCRILTVGKRHFANPADSLFCHIIKIVFCRAVGSGPGHQLPKNAE